MNGDYREGITQLFYKGIVKYSWKYYKGERKGSIIVREFGKVIGMKSWKSIMNPEEDDYVIECLDTGPVLTIRNAFTKKIVYRGDYTGEELMRNGYGFAYDSTSGKVISYGLYRMNELIKLKCEFFGNQMFEYSVDDDTGIIVPSDLRVLYIGGYRIDEDTLKVYRNGKGCCFDPNTGYMVMEGLWESDKLTKITKKPCGWEKMPIYEESLLNVINGTEPIADASVQVSQERIYEKLKMKYNNDNVSDNVFSFSSVPTRPKIPFSFSSNNETINGPPKPVFSFDNNYGSFFRSDHNLPLDSISGFHPGINISKIRRKESVGVPLGNSTPRVIFGNASTKPTFGNYGNGMTASFNSEIKANNNFTFGNTGAIFKGFGNSNNSQNNGVG